MAYYLTLNGTSDYLLVSSMTFDEVRIDFAARQASSKNQWYFDARTGIGFCYVNRGTNNLDGWSSLKEVFYNDVKATINTAFIPYNQRGVLRIVLNAAGTDDVNIFSANGGGAPMAGDLYSVRLLNAGATIAFFDFTTGTLTDQSGNGRTITLNGGTWNQDAPTGTIYSKTLSDNISPLDSISKRLVVSITDSVSSTDLATNQRGRHALLGDSVAIVDAISKKLTLTKVDTVAASEIERESTIRKLADALTQTDAISVTGGKAVLLSDYVSANDTSRKSFAQTRMDGVTMTDIIGRSASVRLYDVILSTDTFQREIPNAPKLIGTVRLTGGITLNVYLLGSHNVNANLRGEI